MLTSLELSNLHLNFTFFFGCKAFYEFRRKFCKRLAKMSNLQLSNKKVVKLFKRLFSLTFEYVLMNPIQVTLTMTHDFMHNTP